MPTTNPLKLLGFASMGARPPGLRASPEEKACYGLMKRTTLLRSALVPCFTLLLSCATSLESISSSASQGPRPQPVQVTQLPDGQLKLAFGPAPAIPAWETLHVEEVQAVLADFLGSLPKTPEFQILLAHASPAGAPAPWELRLRTEFLARYGPPLLPLPASLERSPLFMALRLSPRYMAPGLRDAARELFRSPVFLASVTLSVLVYFSAWMLPDPIFSKAFAATLTARLALAVGLLELRNMALACLQLYQEVQAARTMAEIEAAAERFGRAFGGVALRLLVTVAGFGVAKVLPSVPPGGLGGLLSPPRYAMAGGATLQSATTAHMMADGSLVIAGVAIGTAASSLGRACADGSQKKEGHQWHHLATDKNDSSLDRGGPWTPRFRRIFAKAGMSLDDEANKVYLAGHQGPHPEDYHAIIFERLRQAVEDCNTVAMCRQSLIAELRRIAQEVCNPGSRLHQLATKPQE